MCRTAIETLLTTGLYGQKNLVKRLSFFFLSQSFSKKSDDSNGEFDKGNEVCLQHKPGYRLSA